MLLILQVALGIVVAVLILTYWAEILIGVLALFGVLAAFLLITYLFGWRSLRLSCCLQSGRTWTDRSVVTGRAEPLLCQAA